MRPLVFALLVASSSAFASSAIAADPKLPVIVTSIGPKRVRVRVAAGDALPCSSSSNKKIYEGNLEAGARVDLTTTTSCVCVEHTHGAFSQTDWTQPRLACRARTCDPTGTVCHDVDDKTIRITVSSASE